MAKMYHTASRPDKKGTAPGVKRGIQYNKPMKNGWKSTGGLIDWILMKNRPGKKDTVEKIWSEMDKSITSRAKIVMIKKGVLILEVGNNSDLQELSFKREMIKNSINKNISEKITGIRFRLGG